MIKPNLLNKIFQILYYFDNIFWLNYMKYNIYTWKLGCTRVKTGVNGCSCLSIGALGCRGHGEHKNKAKGRKLWSRRPWFGAYGRGNFPEHHVLSNKSKMGANGPGWVRRGSHGYNRVYLHGEARKQGEMGGKPAIRAYFAGVVTGKKTTRSWQVWSRGSERIQGGELWQTNGFLVRYGC